MMNSQTLVLPHPNEIQKARESLRSSLDPLGEDAALNHIRGDIVPALNFSSRSANYYGFVTGGTTKAAYEADRLVTECDQNVSVHLPNDTIATEVEDRALRLLCDLFLLPAEDFQHRTITTGATASNVLGLACGREYVLAKAGERAGLEKNSVGEFGIFGAMRRAKIDDVQILTSAPHSSLVKAASIVGLGRESVKALNESHLSGIGSLQQLEDHLKRPHTASIVAISCAEVNTGRFATSGYEEMHAIRQLCDKYGAWIHVDAAFGLFARLLSKHDYRQLALGCEGMESADSITGDAHKLLNVPYDCGFFFSRYLDNAVDSFQNANAAYLNSPAAAGPMVPSPLNIGIENSRRFRALPVYTTLVAYGREGYENMIKRQVKLARLIATYLFKHSDYELLPQTEGNLDEAIAATYIIVLFRAKTAGLNNDLVKRLNATRKIFVSGTSWEGSPACRFAVANWDVQPEHDIGLIQQVLDGATQREP